MSQSQSTTDPFELGTEHRLLLQTVFDSWRQQNTWPKWLYVRYELKRHDLDAASVLRTTPSGLVSGLRTDFPQDRDVVSLTISGINYCERAQAQKEAFWLLLEIALDADGRYRPDPDEVHGPEIEETDLISGGVRSEMLQPMSEVLDHWIGILSRPGRSDGGEPKWVLRVEPGVERFSKVRDLDEYVAKVADWLRGPMAGRSVPRQIFVLMPFEDTQTAVYAAIKEAVDEAEGYVCSRSDEITTPGRISFQIIDAITRADVIIADLFGHNPNVMYELGYAHAAGKPTILLAPKRYESPFDIHDWRYIEYSHTELKKLTQKLAAWLREPSVLVKLPMAISVSTPTIGS